ncbi:MAG: acyl-CoA dehydrogenase family protein [Chloroflexota bacterium]
MDLRYSTEDDQFRAHVRDWLAANMPKQKLRTMAERQEWHRQLYEAGFVGMGWPTEYGGRNARPMEQAIVAEELAKANAPAGVNQLAISIVGPTLIHHGTDEQRQRYLKNILTGEELWCQLYSEPNSGSDLASLQTRAEIDGDTFIINGQKIWTSGGHHSDWGLMLARTDPRAQKHNGISCILVDLRSEGVEARPLKQMNGDTGFSEIFFQNVVVPADNLVGELNTGWRIAQTTLSYERGGSLMAAVSQQQRQFQRLIEVAGQMQSNGASALDDPLNRQRIAEIYREIEVLRYAALRILSRLEKGQRPGPESSIAKLHRSEANKRIQALVLEILGPYGLQAADLPPELSLSDDVAYGEAGSWAHAIAGSYGGTIAAGTSEVQKNILGERVLGLPKEIRADRLELADSKKA